MPNEKVLIVDDEKLIRWSVRRQLEEWGYTAFEAESGTGGLAQIRAESPDLILLDVRLPDLSGIEVLREIKQNNLSIPVIMITGDPQLDDIKTAIKLGALDFIKKPLDFDELQITLANAIDRSRLRSERDSLRDEVRKRSGYHEVIGKSPRMLELMNFVRKVAVSETSTVLIQGESGTGKDLVAKAIHYDSVRADKPFVAINCSAIPETLMEAELFGHERGAFTDAKAQKKGLFEVADGGTLFLDEIGEMSTYLQAKLLRALEDQTIRRIGGVKDIGVDIRVIAASNRDLEQGVRDGTFRQDLFYRLSIIPIFMPPLRHRKEDILPLVEFFIERYNFRFRKIVERHHPGNSRLAAAIRLAGKCARAEERRGARHDPGGIGLHPPHVLAHPGDGETAGVRNACAGERSGRRIHGHSLDGQQHRRRVAAVALGKNDPDARAAQAGHFARRGGTRIGGLGA